MQLTVFWKTNFALYESYKRDIWKNFIRLMAVLSVYALLSTFLYMRIIAPSNTIEKYKRLSSAMEKRIDYLNHLQSQIEVRNKYVNHYYQIVKKHKFSYIWSIIWPILSDHLPDNAWIDKIIWKKEGHTSYAMHLFVGIEKTGDELKKINEFIYAIQQTKLMDYFLRIELKEVDKAETKYIARFHIVFLPRKNIGIKI